MAGESRITSAHPQGFSAKTDSELFARSIFYCVTSKRCFLAAFHTLSEIFSNNFLLKKLENTFNDNKMPRF